MAQDRDELGRFAASENVQASDAVAEELAAVAEASRELRKEQEKARKESEKARETLRDELKSATGGAALSGIRSLSSPGAGGTDFAVGVAQGVREATPGLAGALGAVLGGPVGKAIGTGAGEALGAVFDRTAGERIRSREQAISQVSSIGAARAAAGVPLSDAQQSALLSQAFARAMRTSEFEASVRRNAGFLDTIIGRGGR